MGKADAERERHLDNLKNFPIQPVVSQISSWIGINPILVSPLVGSTLIDLESELRRIGDEYTLASARRSEVVDFLTKQFDCLESLQMSLLRDTEIHQFFFDEDWNEFPETNKRQEQWN